MTKPPAGASLLFGALADSGKIKQRKNGTYRMVLDGVDQIDWFTDRPDRVEGTWKPQKLLRRWDKYFATSEPNAQAGFKAGEEQEMVTFEMFKPKMKSEKMMFNIKPISSVQILAMLGFPLHHSSSWFPKSLDVLSAPFALSQKTAPCSRFSEPDFFKLARSSFNSSDWSALSVKPGAP